MAFKILGTCKLGTYKDVNALKNAIKKTRTRIDDWTWSMINNPAFKVADQEEEIILVKMFMAELGLRDGAVYSEICQKVVGIEINFEGQDYTVELCPSEVAPQLCLQYPNHEEGEYSRIAMEAITLENGSQHIFSVESYSSSGLCLNSYGGFAGSVYGNDGYFIFCLRKKA